MKTSASIVRILYLFLLAMLVFAVGCNRGKLIGGDPAYVASQQANLRDRLSAVYNKVGVVKNGERVEILEKSKRFVRVRSPRGEEGWLEARHLVGPEVAEAFEKLQEENVNTPVQAHGSTRAELNMHSTPGRKTDHLYRMDEAAKVEILKRATAEKPQSNVAVPLTTPAKPAAPPQQARGAKAALEPASTVNPAQPAAPAPILEDWFLVRDAQHHTGWVLARMVDVDVPLEIAQYAEGQRIVACFVLNQVTDVNDAGESRQVPQYLMVLNQPKDGTIWDFNQIRVFTWNARRHRYETAYRERDLFGMLPVTVSHESFANEGDLPIFVVRSRDERGNLVERKYKLNQPIVRRVLSPEEQRVEDEKRAARLAELKQQREARRATRPAAVRRQRAR